MNASLRRLLASSVGLMPVTILAGVAKGARWTLYPWTSYWRGTHEPDLQRAIEGLGNGDITGWNCWDLGAHYGIYSVALARRVGPGGQVAAFEPNPESFARLERHRKLNRLTWMKSYRAAVSDFSGEAKLLTYGQLDSTSTHLRYNDDEMEDQNSGPLGVRTVRLDDLVGTGELRPPQFVKIDVEGHGHRAVAGMKLTLAQSRPVLIVGFHSTLEVQGVLAVLGPLRYRWAPIGPPPSAPGDMIGGDYLFSP